MFSFYAKQAGLNPRGDFQKVMAGITADFGINGNGRKQTVKPAARKIVKKYDYKNAAAEWLREILEDGPMPAKEIQSVGRKAGFSYKVLRNAREKVGIKSKKAGYTEGWEWELSIDAKNGQDAQDDQNPLFHPERAPSPHKHTQHIDIINSL